jgi:hypothetical protein
VTGETAVGEEEKAVPAAPDCLTTSDSTDPRWAEAVFQTFLKTSDWREQAEAGERLAGLGAKVLPWFTGAIDTEKDAKLRLACYRWLTGNFPTNPQAVRIFVNGLFDRDPAIRYLCAFHLGQHRIYSSFRALRRVLNDSADDEMTRYAAAKSLAELGEADALPVLYTALGSDHSMPRYMANIGIKALTGKDLHDFNSDYAEGSYVIGGLEFQGPRRPVEDAERRARRFQAIADYCKWLKQEHPEFYKHLDPARF